MALDRILQGLPPERQSNLALAVLTGISVADLCKTWKSEDSLSELARQKVRNVHIYEEIIQGTYPDLKTGEQGTEDMRAIPVV